MIHNLQNKIVVSVWVTSLLLASSCKSTERAPGDSGSETLYSPGMGYGSISEQSSGSSGFFASITRELTKAAHDHAKASFVDGITHLGNNKSARDSIARSLCDRLPIADKATCLGSLTTAADLGTGVGKALSKDIGEAAQGVASVVSNPEAVGQGIFQMGKQFAQDPSGTVIYYKDQALALRDDVVECWNSGTEGKGAVIGHAGLIIFPEAKGAEAVGALGAAGKAVRIGSRGAAVITEVKQEKNVLCQTTTEKGPNGETIVNSVLRVPAVTTPEGSRTIVY